MAKDRYSGKGALVKCNFSGDDTTFVAVGLARKIKPPQEVKAKIDMSGMEDTIPVTDHGNEELSEFNFEHIWDSQDTGDSGVKTLYTNETEVKWQLIVANGTKTWTMEFLGKVFGLEPADTSGTDPLVRSVNVVRTGAITHTVV